MLSSPRVAVNRALARGSDVRGRRAESPPAVAAAANNNDDDSTPSERWINNQRSAEGRRSTNGQVTLEISLRQPSSPEASVLDVAAGYETQEAGTPDRGHWLNRVSDPLPSTDPSDGDSEAAVASAYPPLVKITADQRYSKNKKLGYAEKSRQLNLLFVNPTEAQETLSAMGGYDVSVAEASAEAKDWRLTAYYMDPQCPTPVAVGAVIRILEERGWNKYNDLHLCIAVCIAKYHLKSYYTIEGWNESNGVFKSSNARGCENEYWADWRWMRLLFEENGYDFNLLPHYETYMWRMKFHIVSKKTQAEIRRDRKRARLNKPKKNGKNYETRATAKSPRSFRAVSGGNKF